MMKYVITSLKQSSKRMENREAFHLSKWTWWNLSSYFAQKMCEDVVSDILSFQFIFQKMTKVEITLTLRSYSMRVLNLTVQVAQNILH